MFTFPVIGSLDSAQAAEALQVPAADEGVSWTEDAVRRVVEVTQGFPYFLQEFASQAWDASGGPDTIDLGDVERSIPVATADQLREQWAESSASGEAEVPPATVTIDSGRP
jgi:hypothetical protein